MMTYHTLRFRLVLVDYGHGNRLGYRLMARSEGGAWFVEWESVSRIAVPFEAVERHHLPDHYQSPDLRVTIGPVQEVSGTSEREAYRRMRAVARAAEESGMIAAAPLTTPA